MSMKDTLETAAIVYLVLKAIKWLFIIFWPLLIVEGCAELFGSSISNWSDGAVEITTIICGIIGYGTYKLGKLT